MLLTLCDYFTHVHKTFTATLYIYQTYSKITLLESYNQVVLFFDDIITYFSYKYEENRFLRDIQGYNNTKDYGNNIGGRYDVKRYYQGIGTTD